MYPLVTVKDLSIQTIVLKGMQELIRRHCGMHIWVVHLPRNMPWIQNIVLHHLTTCHHSSLEWSCLMYYLRGSTISEKRHLDFSGHFCCSFEEKLWSNAARALASCLISGEGMSTRTRWLENRIVQVMPRMIQKAELTVATMMTDPPAAAQYLAGAVIKALVECNSWLDFAACLLNVS